MTQYNEQWLGKLRTIVIGNLAQAQQVVIVLHGYAMKPENFAAFFKILNVQTVAYVIPQAPIPIASDSYAWWTIDEVQRAKQLAQGPRDLFSATPEGLEPACHALTHLLRLLQTQVPRAELILGGFSQGGMLAAYIALGCPDIRLTGLFLLSACLINYAALGLNHERALHHLRGLPILIMHGRADLNISLAAADRMRAVFAQAQAEVIWQPFDGGHNLPLIVWRQLQHYLLARSTPPLTGG